MTITTGRPAELEEELAQRPKPGPLVRATGPGFAEIKKHNHDGLVRGMQKLRNAPEPTAVPRYLITYLPVDADDRPAVSRGAKALLIYAIRFPSKESVPDPAKAKRTWPEIVQLLLRRPSWMYLGRITLPDVPWFPPVRNAGAFGGVVEPMVRNRFLERIVRPRPVLRGQGGQRHGIDVKWNELAEFYSELARELAAESGSFRF